ncbi:CheY-like superfamily [Artemisia annua]|uniref:CheY-like superfamily n=1 Tax=Artemisia annua TaxID=35608 RepID=A0A2U1Q5V2_ARTAN|nr:CheY-like superfamily [Artemisia annua]
MGSSSKVEMNEVKEDERPHVLVVDDNVVDRRITERLFTNSAWKVTTAKSAHKALELLSQGKGAHANINYQGPKIDLIVTDYCMPGMTGYEFLKRVKESPDTKGIPEIVVSSDNIPTLIEKCLKKGAQDFILKPLKQSDVNNIKSRD